MGSIEKQEVINQEVDVLSKKMVDNMLTWSHYDLFRMYTEVLVFLQELENHLNKWPVNSAEQADDRHKAIDYISRARLNMDKIFLYRKEAIDPQDAEDFRQLVDAHTAFASES